MRSVSDLASRSLVVSGSVFFLTVLCLLRIAFLELQNLRVEIGPDGQTSFVGKTRGESVITESDYGGATGPRMPTARTCTGERSSRSCPRTESAGARPGGGGPAGVLVVTG